MNPIKKKILVIEDDATLANILIEKLNLEGYEVYYARDGQEGLNFARQIRPAIILLDILMPVLDGYQLMEQLRADPDSALAQTPVVVISNSGSPLEISRALQYGIKDYFVKATFDLGHVTQKVKEYLGDIPAGAADKPVMAEGTRQALKLLIVEDDKFLRDLESQKLSKENLTVFVAVDGEQGIALAQKEIPDIILLDILLPGIDGFVVLTRVKQDPALAKTAVIMLSNFGQRDDIEKAQKLGANKFLIKANYTLDEIVEEVKQVIATSIK